MSENFYDESSYLKEHRLSVYFEDSIRSLLDGRRRPTLTGTNKIDINAHLRDYFLQLKRESHVIGREFAFINATPYNRRAFLGHVWSKCETTTPTPSSPKEVHAVILSLCQDFPFSFIEQSASLVTDVDNASGFDCVAFLRAFQVRFLYDEFLDESQQLFRSFSHRLTCHVPTGEMNFPQPEHNHRQMLLDAFDKLTQSKVFPTPSITIIEEILRSIDQQVNYQKFVVQLAKNEKLSRFIGKEPNGIKQNRAIQQQRSTIEPIPSIQNETILTLASLSTPTTRISSPIAPAPVLPPIPKQQTLVREKPIRQGSPAATASFTQISSAGKRPDSAASFLAPPRSTSAKSNSQMATIIKQEISESDSDVDSRSSDTDN